MTDLTNNLLINMIAERENIHPAHAANRLALATRVAEVAIELDEIDWYATRIERRTYRSATDLLEMVLNGEMFASVVRGALRTRAVPAMGTLSDDTLRLALEIVTAA